LENDGYGALIAKLKDEITGYITDFRERAMSLLRNNEAQLLELKDETRETFSDFNRRLTHLEISVFQVPGPQTQVDEHGNPTSEPAPAKTHDSDGNALDSSPTAPTAEPGKSEANT